MYLGGNEERSDAEKLQLGQVQRRVAVEKEKAVQDCNGQMQSLVIQKQVVLKQNETLVLLLVLIVPDYTCVRYLRSRSVNEGMKLLIVYLHLNQPIYEDLAHVKGYFATAFEQKLEASRAPVLIFLLHVSNIKIQTNTSMSK